MHTKLVVVKLVTMGLGFVIAYQAYLGYRRYGSRTMLTLSVGFVIISVGAIIEGILFDIGGLSFHNSGTVATAIVSVGMLVILYSLFGPDDQFLSAG